MNMDRHRHQINNLNHVLIEKRPVWVQRHGKIILQHDNALFHTTKIVKNTLKALNWKILSHLLYSPDITLSNCHLFVSIRLTRKAALHQFWRSRKMVCLEREKNFLEWYLWFGWKMGKMYRIQWSILWIKKILDSFEN